MGEVIELLPLEIRKELGSLQRLRDDLAERRLVVIATDGTDVTVREAANIESVVTQLETILRRLTLTAKAIS